VNKIIEPESPWVLAFSPNGALILSASPQTLQLWDANSGRQVGATMKVEGESTGHGRHIAETSVAFSPDGTRIVSGTYDEKLRLFDVKSGQPIGSPMQGRDFMTSIAFSPDGTRIVSGDLGNMLRLWDAKSGQQIGAPMKGHEKSVRSVAFNLDGTRIVSYGSDNTLRLWDAKTGEQIEEVSLWEGSSCNVAFSPRDTHIALNCYDKCCG
jgi:WD40 repeat protein